MLHTKPQDHWPFGLPYMGVAAILVSEPDEQTFVPPSR